MEVEVFGLQEQLENEKRFDLALTTGAGRGRPKSGAFVSYVRCLLGTGLLSPLILFSPSCLFPFLSHPLILSFSFSGIGCTARGAREQMLVSASFYMAPKKYEQFRDEVPHLSWFKTQRKGLGYEAWLYAMIRVATCECCLQWGFDETTIDGVPTLNQWVLLAEGGLPPSVCTIECAGVLVGSTSEEIAAHIKQSWANGQVAVGLLRDELGPSADVHVPLTNGGVMLHKLEGVMHDTCNTANKTARLALVQSRP